MAQAQDSERAAAVLLDRASFRYVDESERGLEAEAGSAAPASGSRVDDVSLSVDRKSTRLNSSHSQQSRMPSSA